MSDDFVEGLIPVNSKIDYTSYPDIVDVTGRIIDYHQRIPATLTVTYAITDPAAAQRALSQAMETQQGMFPRLPPKNALRKKLHLPAAEESPLVWLDRRVNEVCKQGRESCG